MDKVQKIKDWISKTQDGLMDAQGNFEHPEHEGAYYILCNLDTYIDSLQEEPKFKTGDRIKPVDSCLGSPRTIVDICNSWYVTDQGTLDFEFEDNWEAVEEPVSEDLEEAAWQYYDRNKPPMPPELDFHKELVDFFKAGVRWKEQNNSNLPEVLVRDNLDKTAEEYSSCTYLEEVLGEGDREVLKARLKNTFKAGAKWQKAKDESTTEDLGEYINKLSKQFPEVSFAKLSRIAVRVAKWQREQMEKEYSNLNKGLATAKGLAVTMAYDKGMADARKAVEIAREEVIKKACEYLDLHCDEVKTEDNGIAGWIDNEFIDNFRKAMKDE